MTAHYVIPLTCPSCAADVEHVAAGRDSALRQAVLMRCTECKWEGALFVELVSVREPKRLRHKEGALA